MELYRITQEHYADDLSGNGARLFGGRWNSEGNFALYTAASRSLALLETLAHAPAKMLGVKVYELVTLYIPEQKNIQKITNNRLLDGWDAPDAHFYSRRIGDEFLRQNKDLLLEVPSVLMPEESNFMLNPLHRQMSKVRITHKRRIYFDKRIL